MKAPVTAPSGRDHQLSQLVAERLLLNFDLSGCTLIRQRDLILFIRPRCGIFSLAVYSFYNYARIKDRARPQMDQLQFHADILTFWRRAKKVGRGTGEEEIVITRGRRRSPCNPQDTCNFHSIDMLWTVFIGRGSFSEPLTGLQRNEILSAR